MPYLIVEEQEGLAHVRFARREALNALNPDIFLELETVWLKLESEPGMRGVIFTGDGEKAFIAGADIMALSQMEASGAASFLKIAHRVLDRIEASPLISIACLHGYTLGGGLEFALACDFIFADEKTILGFPEVSLGLIPGFGAFKRLPCRVGQAKAKQLLLSGEQIHAKEGAKIGLVDYLIENENLFSAALLFMDEVSVGSQAIRQKIKRGLSHPEEADTLFVEAFGCAEAKEQVAAFIEKKRVSHGPV